MPKPPHLLRWAEPDRKTREEWARSRTPEARLVERAKIILPCVQGHSVSDSARRVCVRPNTVLDWRRRFEREGVTGLADRPRPGKPRRYGADFRKQVLAVLEEPPPRRDTPSGTVPRWPGISRHPCMRSGVGCARKASAWVGNGVGA